MAKFLTVTVEYLAVGEEPVLPFSKRAQVVAAAFDKAPDIDKDFIEQRILHIVPPGKNSDVSEGGAS